MFTSLYNSSIVSNNQNEYIYIFGLHIFKACLLWNFQ